MGRPKKGDKSPRSGTTGTKDRARVITDRAHDDLDEIKRERARKPTKVESAFIAASHVSRRDARPLCRRKIARMARKIGAEGVSLGDAASLLFLTHCAVENAYHVGDLGAADYATKARQLVKLTVEVAAAYLDQGVQLPERIAVTLERAESAPPSPFEQGDGGTGDALVVH